MPIIEPEDKTLVALTGVHLWHSGLSSCSQRVRIVLAEKGRSFTSHLVNLQRGENANESYQRIHPKGLVPAIVIDGDLVIESIDIIDELDLRYSMSSLRPKTGSGRREMRAVMALADQVQPNLKLLTFEFLFKALPPQSRDVSEAFQRNHRNEALKRFHRDFEAGFDRRRIVDAVNGCHADFTDLDSRLADERPFLAGDAFSLADIAWMPNAHRFVLIGWPFDRYPFLHAWFERVRLRESYKRGLVDWQPTELDDVVTRKIAERRRAGDGVDAYGDLGDGVQPGERSA